MSLRTGLLYTNAYVSNITRFLFIIQFQNTHKRFLRDLYISDLTHTFFTFFLFLQKFSLSGNIATVTFCQYVFAHRTNSLTRNDFSTDCA